MITSSRPAEGSDPSAIQAASFASASSNSATGESAVRGRQGMRPLHGGVPAAGRGQARRCGFRTMVWTLSNTFLSHSYLRVGNAVIPTRCSRSVTTATPIITTTTLFSTASLHINLKCPIRIFIRHGCVEHQLNGLQGTATTANKEASRFGINSNGRFVARTLWSARVAR